jgi:hypothetical protein
MKKKFKIIINNKYIFDFFRYLCYIYKSKIIIKSLIKKWVANSKINAKKNKT